MSLMIISAIWHWNRLGPGILAGVLAPGQMSPGAIGSKETIRDACVVGEILNNNYNTTTNQIPLLRYLEQKQGTVHDPCTQHHQGVVRPSQLCLLTNTWTCLINLFFFFFITPLVTQAVPLGEWARVSVTCFCSLVLQNETQ